MGRKGEEERLVEMGGGRVIYPTPIEVVSVDNVVTNVFDADGMNVAGIAVDGLLREREEVSLARRGNSTDTESAQDIEDDSGAESDLPPGGSTGY